MHIMIIGGGSLGYSVAKSLREDGHDIVVIEKNKATAKKIAELLDVLVINSDGVDINTLNDADMNLVGVFMALTGNDETNLMACQIAKSSNIERVVARANKEENKKLYEQVGVDVVLSPLLISASAFTDAISKDVKTICILDGHFEIIEHLLEEKGKAHGRSIKELNFPEEARIMIIYRDGKAILPYGDTRLKVKDKLIILSMRNKVKKVLSRL